MSAAPLLDPPQPAKASPRIRRPLRASDTADDHRPMVLVLDPDERTRSVLSLGLSREGFDVIGVASALEAERYLTPEYPLPAMVFCEAELRGGDGFSFCGHLRQQPRTADVPVVLLARHAEDWHRELAGGAGADEFLQKPVFLGDVVALALLLAGRSSTASRYEADTERLPLHKTLRALLSGVRSGRVEIAEGWVAFRNGELVEAACGSLTGEPAVERLLRWGRGEYAVAFGEVTAEQGMQLGAQEYCRRTLPRLEQWLALAAGTVPFDAVLAVDFARLSELLHSLPEGTDAVLRLVDGTRDVESVLRASEGDELACLELISKLHAEGALVPSAAALAPAPAFTEPVEPPRALDDDLRRQLEAFRVRERALHLDGRGGEDGVWDDAGFADAPEQPANAPQPPATLAATTEEEFPPTAQLSPPTKGLSPPTEVFSAPTKELSPPTKGLSRPTKGLSRPTEDDDLAALIAPRGSRLPLYVGTGVLLLLIGAFVWSRVGVREERARRTPVAVVAAPAPEVVPPVVVAEAPPAIAEPAPESPAEEALPTLGPELIEGIGHYENGRFKQAVAVLEPVTVRNAEAVQAWLFLGLARYDLGERAAAEVAVQRVLSRDPENGRALMLLATIHLDGGRKDEARAQLSRYLELYPEGPWARDARELLKRGAR